MACNYKLSTKAKEDLRDIWSYTKDNWSVEKADNYIEILISNINLLSKRLDKGIVIPKVKEGYFLFKIKSHFIFYKRQKNISIYVVRILHEKMDIPFHLKGKF